LSLSGFERFKDVRGLSYPAHAWFESFLSYWLPDFVSEEGVEEGKGRVKIFISQSKFCLNSISQLTAAQIPFFCDFQSQRSKAHFPDEKREIQFPFYPFKSQCSEH